MTDAVGHPTREGANLEAGAAVADTQSRQVLQAWFSPVLDIFPPHV